MSRKLAGVGDGPASNADPAPEVVGRRLDHGLGDVRRQAVAAVLGLCNLRSLLFLALFSGLFARGWWVF